MIIYHTTLDMDNMYTDYLPPGSIPEYEETDVYYKTTDMKYIREKDIITNKKYRRIKQVSPMGVITYKYIEIRDTSNEQINK